MTGEIIRQPVVDSVGNIQLCEFLEQGGMADRVKRRGDQTNKLVTIWRMAMTAAVVEPVGLNANWSSKTSDGGGVSSAG